jgi:hypothetical protein
MTGPRAATAGVIEQLRQEVCDLHAALVSSGLVAWT